MSAIVGKEEYDNLVAMCKAFQKEEGPKLQRYLNIKHLFTSNYVSDWWLGMRLMTCMSILFLSTITPYVLVSLTIGSHPMS